MRSAEKNLLLAVRNLLRTAVASGGAGYSEDQCNIETDDDAPAIQGPLYVIVGAMGWRPGPRHGTSGGVRDLIYSVSVFVAKRITSVPRDRREQAFVLGSGSLNDEIDKCFQVIDWKYEVVTAANALILKETGSQEGFVHPLVFSGMEARPRILPGEFFGASSESAAGMGRLVRFDGARRLTSL